MFNTRKQLIEVYENVKKKYPKYYRARTNQISQELELFFTYCEELYSSKLLTKCAPDWLHKKRIDVSLFPKYSPTFFYTLELAMEEIAKRNIDKPISIIGFSPTTGTSDLILQFNTLNKGISVTEVYNQITDKTKKLITRIEDRSGKTLYYFIMDVYEWYQNNHERLQQLNRGIWNLSPIKTFSGFIHVLLKWMVYNTIFTVVGSKSWINFLISMQNEYGIEFKGTPLPERPGDTNYEHKTIKSPRGRLFELD